MKSKFLYLTLFFFMAYVSGCSPYPSLQGYRKSSIGMSIEQKRAMLERKGSYASQIGWSEQTFNLSNGHWVYVEPDSPECFIHWEVNPEGIIIDSQVKGQRCSWW